jgi:hypothetical protein
VVAFAASSYRLLPGGAEAFRTVAGEHARYLERFGARVSLLRALVAGELSGRVQVYAAFRDGAARGATFDAIPADGANSPMARALNAAPEPGPLTQAIEHGALSIAGSSIATAYEA